MSECKNVTRMLDAMHICFFVLIAHDSIAALIDTVRELASSFVKYILCGMPSAHPCGLIVLSLFFFRNIEYLNSLFCSFCDIFFLWRAFVPHVDVLVRIIPWNFLSSCLCLMFICVRITCMWSLRWIDVYLCTPVVSPVCAIDIFTFW